MLQKNDHRALLLFAASFDASGGLAKLIFVDVTSGDVHLRAMAHSTNRSVPWLRAFADPPPDECVCVLEAHAARLAAGDLIASELIPGEPITRSICLYPVRGPTVSSAITRGVRVVASALFVPEKVFAGEDFYAYSVSFALLSEDQQRAAWPSSAGPFRLTCQVQLTHRRWSISDASGEQKVVEGEGVVGEHPLLAAGAKPFVYSSCTPIRSSPGLMSGAFTFVEGSIARPSGGSFAALCSPFALMRPDFRL